VHLFVSGGCIGHDGASWREAKHPFIEPVRALSRLVLGKFHDALEKERPDIEARLPVSVWTRDWVAWCKPWGQGETAVFDYLAHYVQRIAISPGSPSIIQCPRRYALTGPRLRIGCAG